MKIFLTFFVLLFSQTLYAQEKIDFRIEGMAIGDSLLDYFSKQEIKKFIREDYLNYTDKKYNIAEIQSPNFKEYFSVQVLFKTKFTTFIILLFPNTIIHFFKINVIINKPSFINFISFVPRIDVLNSNFVIIIF